MRSGLRFRSLLLCSVAAALLMSATCTPANPDDHQTRGPTSGGTLRIATLNDSDQSFDPQKAISPLANELFRCCLLRTLMATNGRATEQGGSVIRPDLAEGMPTVSTDGLTWTFHLRPGLHYAPPLEETEITARDIIRALEREGDLLASSGLTSSGAYNVIAGFEDFAEGKAQTINGLSALDPYTLVVQLRQPTGDLAYRFSLPASAPIPPAPEGAAGGRLGVAEGLELDYGRHLVASGPYMFEGSEDLDPSADPDRQPAVGGYEPGRSITLVRNPSWVPESDPLRPAYPDRIEIAIHVQPAPFGLFDNGWFSRTAARLAPGVDAGKIDLVLDQNAPGEQVDRYLADAGSRARVRTGRSNVVVFLSMNLAVPPFDDPHVRRAVNLIVDRDALTTNYARNGTPAVPITHVAPDSLEGGLLTAFDPSHEAGSSAAREEMAASRYAGPDGLCHDPSCRNVPLFDLIGPVSCPLVSCGPGYAPGTAASLADDLRELGIEAVASEAPGPLYSGDPTIGAPLVLSVFRPDFTNASNFFVSAFFGPGIVGSTAFTKANLNTSLVGATASELRQWGYPVTKVPSVDGPIESCLPLIGTEQTQCWAEVDQRLMTEILPWAPLVAFEENRVVSARVTNFAFDQYTGLPALDRIALAPEVG